MGKKYNYEKEGREGGGNIFLENIYPWVYLGQKFVEELDDPGVLVGEVVELDRVLQQTPLLRV